MIYGYIRVSTDKQDTENQKIGILEKAQSLGYEIEDWISDDGVSGAKEPDKRKLGALMKKLKEGDVLIISELSRLGRTVYMLFEIVRHCESVGCTIYSVKDSFNTIKKGDLISTVLLFAFGLSAQIEREMIIKRTVEGLERRRREGVIFGRPVGAKGKTKLDGKEDIIRQYIEAGVGLSGIARILKVHRATLHKFISEKNISYTSKAMPKQFETNFENNTPLRKAKEIDLKISPYKQQIIDMIDAGKTQTDMSKFLFSEGINVSNTNITTYLRRNGLWEYYITTHSEIRKERNKNCGKYKELKLEKYANN
jgi:DNA invertase Pin-like site-specific DNA recombinase